MDSEPKKTWLQWLPPRVRDLGMTRYGPRPLIGLAFLVALSTLGIWREKWIADTALPYLAHGIQLLSGLSVGFFGALLFVWLIGLLTLAFIESSPVVASAQKWFHRRSRASVLEASLLDANASLDENRDLLTHAAEREQELQRELSEARATLQQHLDAMEYGNRLLNNPAPLTPSDLGFLKTDVSAMQNVLVSAWLAVGKMRDQVLGKMLDRGEQDAAYHLAAVVKDQDVKQSERVFARLSRQSQELVDSREAIASASNCYARDLHRLFLLARCVGLHLGSLEGHAVWSEADIRYRTLFKVKLEAPYLADVKRCIHL